MYTIFDTIIDNSQNVNVNYDTLRTGRVGGAMIALGTYLLYVGLGVLIPDKTDEVSFTLG